VKAVDAALNMDGHKTTPGYIDRAWLADEVFYNSPLYQNEPDRGRLPVTDREYTNQLGLMLITQVDDAKGLPTETSRWLAECDVRVPRMDSRTARDYLDNDALFVTGPSGMTSLFLGQMEVLANFESEALKRYYLSAVIAYVAASGFHSMHEIIGPAQYALNLVPGYPIKAPDLINHTKAPAPHYHHYFNYMSIIDPGFADLKERAWQQYLNYFNDIYLQKNGVKERLQTETVVKPVSKKRDPWFHFFRAGKKTAALPAELSLQGW
jgi:hypothetical protein